MIDTPKYKVYAIQGVQFSTVEIEANTQEEATQLYDKHWCMGTEIVSVDYLPDEVRHIVQEIK